MIYVAQIEDGLVVRVVVSPASIAPPEGWSVVGPENVVGIGWGFADGRFTAPEDREPEE